MSHKKFAVMPPKVGFTIIKHDGKLWHLINIDENRKYRWLEVTENKDGSFTGTNPNRVMVTVAALKDES